MIEQTKFRAWDKLGGMFKPMTLEEIGRYAIKQKGTIRNHGGMRGVRMEVGTPIKHLIWMQDTEFKDKDNKEIFDSDFVQTPAGVGLIKKYNGLWMICWNDIDKTTLHDTPQGMLQVIGNIYENPELLK